MNTITIIKRMEEFKKDYYTLSDLVKLTGIKRQSLKVRINRMIKKGFITRAARNIYTLPEKRVDAEKTANGLVTPSYLSFDYLLSKKGIISESPYEIEFATSKRTRRKVIAGIRVTYKNIKKELFFGFTMSGGIYTAEAEKALLDSVYFKAFGKQTGNLKIDKNKINITKLKRYSRRYPEKVRNYLRKTGLI